MTHTQYFARWTEERPWFVLPRKKPPAIITPMMGTITFVSGMTLTVLSGQLNVSPMSPLNEPRSRIVLLPEYRQFVEHPN